MASSPGRAPIVARTPPPEHITRLFPKCRPRQIDHNLNPVHGNLMNSTRSINDNLIMDHSTTEPSDRIIEIAGGREVFCQSRSRVGRKGRQMHRAGRRDRNDITLDAIYASEANSNRRCNSRDSTDSPPPVVFPVQHSPPPPAPSHPRGSPCSPPAESPPPLSPPQHDKGSPMAVTSAGGEVVVFDDIGDNWQGRGLRLDFDNSDNELDNGLQRTITVDTVPQQFPNTERSSPLDEESERSSGDEGGDDDDVEGDSNCSSTGIGHRVARVIGNMPISEYQESPRRYGPPRPGFPQRILANNSPSPPLTQQSIAPSSTTFDYLYEFSETRKVLEEFFKCPKPTDNENDTGTLDDINDFQDLEYKLRRHQRNQEDDERRIINDGDLLDGLGLVDGDGDGDGADEERGSGTGSWYVGQRLARPPSHHSPHSRHNHTNFLGLQQECEPYEPEVNLVELSVGTGSSESESRRGLSRDVEIRNIVTTNNGISSTLSSTAVNNVLNNINNASVNNVRTPTQINHISNHHHHHKHRFTLSPETTDCESNCGDVDSDISLILAENESNLISQSMNAVNRPVPCMPILEDGLSSGHASDVDNNNPHPPTPPPLPLTSNTTQITKPQLIVENGIKSEVGPLSDADLNSLDPLGRWSTAPPPPAPEAHRSSGAPPAPPSPAPPIPPQTNVVLADAQEQPPPPAAAALRDIRLALRRARALPPPAPRPPEPQPPVLWLPSRRDPSRESIESMERKPTSGDEDEADTDLETDRLLGQQRTDDQGFYDDKGWRKGGGAESPMSEPPPPPTPPPPPPVLSEAPANDDTKHKKDKDGKKKGKNKEGLDDPSVLIEGVLFRARYLGSTQLVCEGQPTKATRMLQAEEAVSRIKETTANVESSNTQPQLQSQQAYASEGVYTTTGGEHSPTGTVFRLSFLGSVEVEEEGPGRRRRKRLKKNMVEEAVTKIKAPEGESQPSTEVDLFISTEKIMVLNTDLKEIMMDHALRTISYIADIGDLVVLMARRRFVPHEMEDPPKVNRTPKMICHVFESEEAQFIAQSIGQAFQVAYMEFLKANGIEDHSFVKEMDYQEVLNSQEIFGDELQMFAKKEMQKEVVVPKAKGEILGVVIVESGWGSMLPTVVIANLAPAGAAARCGQLNIGDQIIAINGVSLVGLPLSTCQTYIKNSKNQTVVKLTVVPCAPVVEVKIKRPDTKYQLGFSVQNGVICSLLRGGIAERGGVRVGHRIIEINNQSVVAVPHERIVNLLATSVGEILMKTMPTSMFRLLTGQENPVYI